jgi:hypothetical protein
MACPPSLPADALLLDSSPALPLDSFLALSLESFRSLLLDPATGRGPATGSGPTNIFAKIVLVHREHGGRVLCSSLLTDVAHGALLEVP